MALHETGGYDYFSIPQLHAGEIRRFAEGVRHRNEQRRRRQQQRHGGSRDGPQAQKQRIKDGQRSERQRLLDDLNAELS